MIGACFNGGMPRCCGVAQEPTSLQVCGSSPAWNAKCPPANHSPEVLGAGYFAYRIHKDLTLMGR